jgi:hypothetical protein
MQVQKSFHGRIVMNKKILFSVFLMMVFQSLLWADSNLNRGKFELIIGQSNLFITNDNVSTVRSTAGTRDIKYKTANLNLCGFGLRYYPNSTVYVEINSESLLSRQAVVKNLSIDPSADLTMNRFSKVTLIAQKIFWVGDKMSFSGGAGFSYIASELIEDSPVSIPNWWTEHFSPCLSIGLDCLFTSDLKGNVSISYYTASDIKYQNTQANPAMEFTLPFSPIMVQVKLLFNI